jgi:Holliday junction resolvase RusA-like endonuclease
MSDVQVIRLPMPPPLNNLFVNRRGGRAKSGRYESWITEAGLKLNMQRPTPVSGHFAVTMVFVRPDRRRRDLDGLAKAILDLFVKHGVTDDDALCDSIWLRWSAGEPDPSGGVSVTVEAAQ